MSNAPVMESENAIGSLVPRFAMGRVVLTVNDLDRVRSFYEHVAGLHLLHQDGTTAELGIGDRVLLELRRDGSARRRSPREAGLFHTAFLLPSRGDLAHWVKNAIEKRTPVVGTSDHSVSEAIYLTDPEKNGVEIYADRPKSSWVWNNGAVTMPSDPLDLNALLAVAGDRNWAGFPEGSTLGHVHLQVGAIAPAEAFYSDLLGLDVTCRYSGGSFYAADGYHHHIATNIWNSRGATPRDYPSTGLAGLEIEIDPSRAGLISTRGRGLTADDQRFRLRDPWNTEIAIVPVATRRSVNQRKGS